MYVVCNPQACGIFAAKQASSLHLLFRFIASSFLKSHFYYQLENDIWMHADDSVGVTLPMEAGKPFRAQNCWYRKDRRKSGWIDWDVGL